MAMIWITRDQASIAPIEGFSKPMAKTLRTEGGLFPWPEVVDTGSEYVLTLQVPSMESDDFDINFGDHCLTVSAHGSADSEGARDGSLSSKFSYTFRLPESVEAGEIHVELRDGVLVLHVPKHVETRNCRIRVQ